VGWGQVGIASEFTLTGALNFQLTLPALVESYRAYRFPWSAEPSGRPVMVATRVAGSSTTQLYASWNGATGVTGWQVYAGTSPTARFQPVGAVTPSSGFETEITVASTAPYVAVQPLGPGNKPLATSAIEPVKPPAT
jgi:hypothetical protein